MTEIDEKEYISLKIIVSELRNQYVSITIAVIMQMIWKILHFDVHKVLANTDLSKFVNNIWEKSGFCVHRKSLRSLSSAHEKWGQKQKCCVYNFVQYMCCLGVVITDLIKCRCPAGNVTWHDPEEHREDQEAEEQQYRCSVLRSPFLFILGPLFHHLELALAFRWF